MRKLLRWILSLSDRSSGPAIWASTRELRAAKLHDVAVSDHSDRVVLGVASPTSWKTEAIASAHGAPILVIGPARSGKTAGIARPTLRGWQGSALVVEARADLQPAVETKASNGRTKNYRFAPWDPDGHSVCYNPLHDIRLGSHKEKGDVAVIAKALASGAISTPAISRNSLAKVFECLIFYALYTTDTPSLASVARFVGGVTSTEEMSAAFASTQHFPFAPFQLASDDLVRAASELKTDCRLFDAPLWQDVRSILLPFLCATVSRKMSWCDFHLSDLLDSVDPIVLYVGDGAVGSVEQRTISRLIVEMSLHRLSERPNDTGREVLVLVEDFTRLGVISGAVGLLPYLGSYGVHLVLTTSSFASIDQTYGPSAQLFYENAARVVITPASYDDANRLVVDSNTAHQLLPCMLGKIPPGPVEQVKVSLSHIHSLRLARNSGPTQHWSPALLFGFTRRPALISIPCAENNIQKLVFPKTQTPFEILRGDAQDLGRSAKAANDISSGSTGQKNGIGKRGRHDTSYP